MFGVGGETELPESTLDHLSGYDGARPVRVGNAAVRSAPERVYGAFLDSVYVHSKIRDEPCPRTLAARQGPGRGGHAAWREPDQGIWETRGEPLPLRLLEADVVGGAGSWSAPGPQGEGETSMRSAGERGTRHSRRRSWSAGSASAASSASTTTRTPSMPRRSSSPSCASCRRTTRACGRRCSPSPTSSPSTAWCSAIAPRRATTGLNGRRGHLHHLLVLAGLGPRRDRRGRAGA